MKGSMCAAGLMACLTLAAGAGGADTVIRRFDGKPVSSATIDREAKRMMAEAKVQGLAMAVIDGAVVFVSSWGRRNVEKNLPLQTDTIMYGASLTKLASHTWSCNWWMKERWTSIGRLRPTCPSRCPIRVLRGAEGGRALAR
jgi:hypothetical protein